MFIARFGSRSKKKRDLLQTLQKKADRISKAFWSPTKLNRARPARRPSISFARGSRRHIYNQLFAHFQQPGAKCSKATVYQNFIKTISPAFPWYNEVSS